MTETEITNITQVINDKLGIAIDNTQQGIGLTFETILRNFINYQIITHWIGVLVTGIILAISIYVILKIRKKEKIMWLDNHFSYIALLSGSLSLIMLIYIIKMLILYYNFPEIALIKYLFGRK